MISSLGVSSPESHADRNPLRVLLTGDNDGLSAPQRSATRALRRSGVDANFRPDLPLVDGKSWWKAVRNADAIVHLEYGNDQPYSARQLAIATALGRSVIRSWVGTDVLECLQNRAFRNKAALIQGVVTASVACAPHLVDELKSIGLSAQFIPSMLDSEVIERAEVLPEVPHSVLVYLPTHRLEFYGAGAVKELALMNPDIEFVVVGDESHHLACIPNVRSLGWVSDMQRIYAETGCVLRLTQHDGLPRVIVEALFRGRYAIHAWPLEGCWLAKTAEQAHEKLKLFRAVEGPNLDGAAAMARLYEPPPETQYVRLLKQSMKDAGISRRISAFATAVRLTVEGRLKKKAARGTTQ